MKFRSVPTTPTTRTAVGGSDTPVAPVETALRNMPCNVKITVQMEGYPAIEVTLEDENEVRNVMARFAPKAIITENPAEVLKHLTDDTNPLFNAMLTTGKAMGLDLPVGL